MTDQLKIEPIRRHVRTIFPATVACSNAKRSPPAARIFRAKVGANLFDSIAHPALKEKQEIEFQAQKAANEC
jgi:hypothetical protein